MLLRVDFVEEVDVFKLVLTGATVGCTTAVAGAGAKGAEAGFVEAGVETTGVGAV
jgi:hypothetical protein